MVSGIVMNIEYSARRLTYDDASRIAQQVLSAAALSPSVVLSLEQTTETTTAALARLVLLRKQLLKAGRDLKVIGLSGRANDLYEITRMSGLLPRSSRTRT